MINIESLVVPAALGWPERLKHIRSNLLDVLREYEVEFAGIRLAEPTAKQFSVERTHIEGVVQEAFASSELLGFYTGAISTLAARLGVERPAIKRMVEGANELAIANWDQMDVKKREAVLTAIGAARV
ncbi:hypothetical protein [Brevundimonas sp. M1A4_2e]